MIIVADAGNTKTDWILITRDKDHYVKFRSSGISPYFNTQKEIKEKFIEVYDHFKDVKPERVFFYGTGCYRKNMRSKIYNILISVFSESNVVVDEDLNATGLALFADKEGLACISGTGSNAGIIKNGKIISRHNSLGYLLGDEGSGADIGFRFLKILLSGKINKEIAEKFYSSFSLTPEMLISKIYNEKKPQSFAASLLPFISEYRKDELVSSIIKHSFNDMVNEMIIPLTGNNRNIPTGFCGGAAFRFANELKYVFYEHSFNVEKILQEPLSSLANYFHKKYYK